MFGINPKSFKHATRDSLSALALKANDRIMAHMQKKGMNPRNRRDNEPTLEYSRYLHGKLTHRHPHQESYVEIAPAKHHMAHIAKIESLLSEGKGADDVDPLLKKFRKEDMEKYSGHVKKALNRILSHLGREEWPYKKAIRRPSPAREEVAQAFREFVGMIFENIHTLSPEQIAKIPVSRLRQTIAIARKKLSPEEKHRQITEKLKQYGIIGKAKPPRKFEEHWKKITNPRHPFLIRNDKGERIPLRVDGNGVFAQDS